ncbi:MAG: hypothetical protein KF797_07300 [Flavobacteriales bacterium]|nr:hypothetical protein [Flavobacteriales bacterium]
MNSAELKLDLMQRLMAFKDTAFLERLHGLVVRKERGEDIREREIEGMMAAASTFDAVAYGENEPDISGITLQEPNPGYKPWKPEV